VTTPLKRPPSEREQLAEELLDRLTPMMSALGVILVLVILGEQLARPGSGVATALSWVSWTLWGLFLMEFVARMVVAPNTWRFFRRNWWQLIFIAIPLLRVLRLVRAFRFLRTGRVLSGAVRGSRSTASVLRSRLGWLASLWVITVLAVSQVLHTFGAFDLYAAALHATALGAITGESLAADGALARVTEIFLGIVSVGVFGTIAASLGAFFLQSDSGVAGTNP